MNKNKYLCRLFGHRWKPGAVFVTDCCITRSEFCDRCLAVRQVKSK